jgi:hypothetical protein
MIATLTAFQKRPHLLLFHLMDRLDSPPPPPSLQGKETMDESEEGDEGLMFFKEGCQGSCPQKCHSQQTI